MSQNAAPGRYGPVLLGTLAVVAAAAGISFSSVLSPLAYAEGANALTLILLRFVGSVLVCGLWLKLSGQAFAIPRRVALVCLGAGLGYAGGSGLLLVSFETVPVSLAVLVFFTFPLLTMAWTALLERRWPLPLQLFCVLAAFGGLALMLGVDTSRLHPVGLTCAILAAFGVSSAFVWTGRAIPDIPSVLVTFHMSLVGLGAAACVVLVGDFWSPPAPGGPGWLLVAGVVAGFCLAFFGMFAGVQRIGALPAALLLNLEPVFTVTLALLLLGEQLSPPQLFGAAVVVLAVSLAQRAMARD